MPETKMDNAIAIALLNKGMADLSAQVQSMSIDVKKFLDARYITEERFNVEINELEKKNKEYISSSLESLVDDVKSLKNGVWWTIGVVGVILLGALLKPILKV